MPEPIEEKVELLDRLRRIEPSAREITVTFDGIAGQEAWPDEVAGVIMNGLSDSEAVMLAPFGRNRDGSAELYIANRATHRGNRLRYLLADLQREGPGRFRFKAVRGFEP